MVSRIRLDVVRQLQVEAGFRVLRFDLFGRGYSDRPNGRNDPAYFNRQIKELLGALQVEVPVHLMGIASGGLTSVLYTAQYPNDVSSLTLICTEGFGATPSIVRLLRTMPVVSDYIVDISGDKLILGRLNNYSQDPAIVNDLRNRFRPSIHIKGFKRSFLSLLRNMPIWSAGPVYQRVEQLRILTLIVWGNQNHITPVAMAKPVHEAMPHAELRVLESGHLPQYEHPKVFTPILLDFLRSRAKGGPQAQK